MQIANVTLLFTDLVDSTTLSQSVSVGEADALRRQHFSILRQAIAQHEGSEVKNLGDGLMVVFDSASAAIACAVGMQQRVERDNRSQGRTISIRIGISAGETSREEGDYFGDPVVEAARLCNTARSGQILCSEVARAVAGRRNLHSWNALGPMALKGLVDPVDVVEILWEPLAPESGSSMQLPGRLARAPQVGVVGRTDELAEIALARKRVDSACQREILVVAGEAGLGKTTLVAEAARAAFDEGAIVLFGHCEEDLALPYQLFAEALTHYVVYAPEDQLRQAIEGHGSELARLVPVLADRFPELPPSRATDAESERYLLFAAVVALLAAVSKHQPVVIAFDDLQWADAGSLSLLRHLAVVEHPMRVLILGSYRDTELAIAQGLRDTLGVLRRYTGVSRIELAGLDSAGVTSFVAAAAGHELDSDGVALALALYRETDGNPFFVEEVLRHLSETGAIRQEVDGRWVTTASFDPQDLPESVREVIGGRVARLGREAERVLQLAAVIGRDFDLELLARASEQNENDVLDILDAAKAAALVRELQGGTGRYNFAHALIQHTLYRDLGPTRRSRAHRQVGLALEELCGDTPGARIGELARHWVNTVQAVDLNKAISYLRQAGDAALGSLAPADALHYYAQAIELCGDAGVDETGLRIDLAIGLGMAQRQTGDASYRDTLLDAGHRALAAGDNDRLADAALASNRGFFSQIGTIDAGKVEILEQALQRVPGSSPKRALLLATLCSELAVGSPLAHRQALAEEALAIAHVNGEESVTLSVLNHVAFPMMVPSLVGVLMERTAEAVEQAERLGDPMHRYFAAKWRSQVAARASDFKAADQALARELELAAELDQPLLNWSSGFAASWRALVAGDTDRADQLAQKALQVGTDGGQVDAALIFGGQLIDLNRQRGTLGSLLPLIEDLVANAPEVSDALLGAQTLGYCEAGDWKQARALLERLAAAGFTLAMDPVWGLAICYYSSAVIELGDPEFAGALYDAILPWVDQWAATGASDAGPLSVCAAGLASVLGRRQEAEELFRRTAAHTEQVGANFDRVRNNLYWGRMLAGGDSASDKERAATLLEKARDEAVTKGYGGIERNAIAALSALR